MKYLSSEELLVIHSEIIDQVGGAHGVRDIHLFSSIIKKPKSSFGGKELYDGIFMKSAVYLEAISKYHVFVDGNKRTAFLAASRFLFLNGVDVTAKNKEVVDFMLRVIEERIDIQEIAKWLESKSKKI